jgi:hypothetical protein
MKRDTYKVRNENGQVVGTVVRQTDGIWCGFLLDCKAVGSGSSRRGDVINEVLKAAETHHIGDVNEGTPVDCIECAWSGSFADALEHDETCPECGGTIEVSE